MSELNPIIDFYLRGFPIINPLILLVYGLIYNKKYFIKYIFLATIIDLISVKSLKYMTKQLYNFLDVETLPILGLGRRPDGAISCGLYKDNKPSDSFGMPSGHALFCGFSFVYWYYYLCENSQSKYKKIIIFILFIINCLLALSRVYLGCHTIEQVIVGFIIGSFIAFILNYVNKNLKI